MQSDKGERELFEFEKPKRAFPRIGEIFFKKGRGFDNKFSLTLTSERIIFLGIGMVMLMVLVYALGVERGKSAVRAQTVAAQAGAAVGRGIVIKQPAAIVPPARPEIPKPPKINIPEVKPVALPQATGKRYTIVAAAFSNNGNAAAVVNQLKREGLEAYVAPSGTYFQVCVGSYEKKEAAQPVLNKVKRLYKDAYVKLK